MASIGDTKNVNSLLRIDDAIKAGRSGDVAIHENASQEASRQFNSYHLHICLYHQPSASSPSTSIAHLPASDPSRRNETESESNGENSDPDFEPDEDLNAYFEDANPSNDRQKWLVGFY